MADVQLEHGYYQIANRLAEAALFADFNVTQFKIFNCIVRQSYGWGKLTVRMSQAEIAERCRLSITGGFRRSLDELLREHVLIEVEPGVGRTPAAYMVNKDFESWGRLSVPSGALERLYGERPANVDGVSRLPRRGTSIEGHSTVDRPDGGTPARPVRGTLDAANGANDNNLTPPKDTTEKQVGIASTAGATLDAVQLVVAANLGLSEHEKRPQKIPRILPTQGWTVDAVEQLTAGGVPQAFAEQAIYEAARTHRSHTPIVSLGYFVPGTLRMWEAQTIADSMAKATRPASLPKPERRRPTAEDREAARVRERALEEERARLDRRYVTERRAAVAAWATTHAAEYAVLVESVKAEMNGIGPMSETMIAGVVDMTCVDQYQCFATLEEWMAARRSA